MNKRLIFNELDTKKKINDGPIKGNRVIIRDAATGKILNEGYNKVIASGSAYIASEHFDFGDNPVPKPATPTYDDTFAKSPNRTIITGNNVPAEPTNPKRIYLFAIGTDGCDEFGVQQYEVDYTKWIRPDSLVPFRFTADPIDDINLHNRYGGVVQFTDQNRYAYYFKTFETDPLWIQRYIGSNDDIKNMYNSASKDPMESYVELKLMVTSAETREWFKYMHGTSNAYVNTISLIQGWYYNVGGMRYYKDLHPVTKYNFPTESLRESTKGLDITYHVFY